MAITKCKECGANVSTSAKACPSCGAPVKRTFGFGSFFAAATVMVMVVTCAHSPKKPEDQNGEMGGQVVSSAPPVPNHPATVEPPKPSPSYITSSDDEYGYAVGVGGEISKEVKFIRYLGIRGGKIYAQMVNKDPATRLTDQSYMSCQPPCDIIELKSVSIYRPPIIKTITYSPNSLAGIVIDDIRNGFLKIHPTGDSLLGSEERSLPVAAASSAIAPSSPESEEALEAAPPEAKDQK